MDRQPTDGDDHDNDNDNDQWLPETWPPTTFPPLPLQYTQGLDVDFRWGANWFDDQPAAAEAADPAATDPSAPQLTNWPALQDVCPHIPEHAATTADHWMQDSQISPAVPDFSPTTINPSSTLNQPATTSPLQPPFQQSDPAPEPTASSPKKRKKKAHLHHHSSSPSPPPTTETQRTPRPRKAKAPIRRHSSQASSAPTSTTTTTTASSSQPAPPPRAPAPPHSNASSASAPSTTHNTPAYHHHHHHRVPHAFTSRSTSPTRGIEIEYGEASARVPHKAVEKKYREGIKAMFRRLSAAIPGLHDDERPEDVPAFLLEEGERGKGAASAKARLTKAGIIQRAIEYIRELEGEKSEVEAGYERVVGENERLRREVEGLRREVEEERRRQGGFGGGGFPYAGGWMGEGFG
ncbi:Ty-mediated expression protein [Neofusicoccum ribis]|uniref:Ty-mediated expression protein n=1 Tax=Neofusicoccum ribis TaxID=45134 RepID=A0ABR3SJQ2_9PEZI